MTPTDSDLIARSLAYDDREAFGELVMRHQSAVRRFLRHLSSGDSALADDLAQETFIQAHKSLARFRSDSTFTTWLLGIAHNHWRNARRKKKAEPISELPERPDEGAVSPSHAVALKQDLALALAALSPDEQAVLHLCYQQGLSHAEASGVLELPLGTIKTHLARSKDKLRLSLASWNPRT